MLLKKRERESEKTKLNQTKQPNNIRQHLKKKRVHLWSKMDKIFLEGNFAEFIKGLTNTYLILYPTFRILFFQKITVVVPPGMFREAIPVMSQKYSWVPKLENIHSKIYVTENIF